MNRQSTRRVVFRAAQVPLFAALWSVGHLADAAKFGGLAAGQAETLVAFADGDSPEGITVHKDTLYVGNRHLSVDGLVSEILRISPDGVISPLATFEPPATDPNAQGVLGLAIGRQGDVLAAVHTLDAATHGVWRLGSEGDITRLPGSEAISFPNALTFDARGNLYVTDSLRFTPAGTLTGGVWRFTPDGTSELWLEHPALGPSTLQHPLGIPPVGANGIAFHPGKGLFVANTQNGELLNIAINPDGTPQEPVIVAGGPTLLTLDGIALDAKGHVHGVVPGFAVLTSIAPLVGLPIPPDGVPPVVAVDPTSGSVARSSLASFDELFDFPVSVAFDGESVFATNAAFRGLSPLPIPEPGPSVVEIGVGVPRFPIFGNGRLVGGPTTIPEPSTLVVTLMLLVGLVAKARLSRKEVCELCRVG